MNYNFNEYLDKIKKIEEISTSVVVDSFEKMIEKEIALEIPTTAVFSTLICKKIQNVIKAALGDEAAKTYKETVIELLNKEDI